MSPQALQRRIRLVFLFWLGLLLAFGLLLLLGCSHSTPVHRSFLFGINNFSVQSPPPSTPPEIHVHIHPHSTNR